MSRNDLVYEPTESVSAEEFEVIVHEKHATEMVVTVDYDTIYFTSKG